MLLGPISYLDCFVFCVFLTPQLLCHVGLASVTVCALRYIPFVLFRLPLDFIRDRFWRRDRLSPFARQADGFEDFVIRCVRFAFANVPPPIARVFFHRNVALPFLKFRMLRHGYLRSPIHWRELREVRMTAASRPISPSSTVAVGSARNELTGASRNISRESGLFRMYQSVLTWSCTISMVRDPPMKLPT